MEDLKLCAVMDFIPVLELAKIICEFAKPTPAPDGYYYWAQSPYCMPLLDIPEYDCFGNYGHVPMSCVELPLFS